MNHSYLLELLHVVGLGDIVAFVGKVSLLLFVMDHVDLDELLELGLHLVHVDVGTPDDQLGLSRRLRGHQRVCKRSC